MKPADVKEYIAQAPKEVQAKLKELRIAIRSAAPKAEEKLSYSMPYYGYEGRLAYFAYSKNHIGLYLMPPVIKEYKDKLKNYSIATSAIRFPLDEKLPIGLIKKMVKTGVKNNEAKKK